MRALNAYVCLVLFLYSATSYAYIGPGASAGTIAVVFGIIASMFLAFVAIIWYPLKRLVKGNRRGRAKSKKGSPDAE
jgi:hypothetical protein